MIIENSPDFEWRDDAPLPEAMRGELGGGGRCESSCCLTAPPPLDAVLVFRADVIVEVGVLNSGVAGGGGLVDDSGSHCGWAATGWCSGSDGFLLEASE